MNNCPSTLQNVTGVHDLKVNKYQLWIFILDFVSFIIYLSLHWQIWSNVVFEDFHCYFNSTRIFKDNFWQLKIYSKAFSFEKLQFPDKNRIKLKDVLTKFPQEYKVICCCFYCNSLSMMWRPTKSPARFILVIRSPISFWASTYNHRWLCSLKNTNYSWILYFL